MGRRTGLGVGGRLWQRRWKLRCQCAVVAVVTPATLLLDAAMAVDVAVDVAVTAAAG